MSYIRRLRWLILLGGFCAACATVKSTLPPGHVIDKPGLVDAQALVWRVAYGRTDASPLVYVVEGDELTCSDPNSGTPGFECVGIGCRNGCTGNPFAVSVAVGSPWSATTLAHEDMHARKLREAIAVLKYSPTLAAMQLLGDRDHQGPEWQPGGEVDKANLMLVRAGL